VKAGPEEIPRALYVERRKMTRLFTYVIAEDWGFAPNPFFGVLTLNCCKPQIRQQAEVGDWVAANTAADFPGGGACSSTLPGSPPR
jgi:hypothetical protein